MLKNKNREAITINFLTAFIALKGYPFKNIGINHESSVKHSYVAEPTTLRDLSTVRGMFEMNCSLSSSSIFTWGTIKTNTYLYRAIQYLHNGV